MTITNVEPTGDVGKYTSLALGTDGIPVVSHYEITNSRLKVAQCSSASCVLP